MPNTTVGDRTVVVESPMPPPRRWTNELIDKLRDLVRPMTPASTGARLDVRIIAVAAILVVGLVLILRKRKRG